MARRRRAAIGRRLQHPMPSRAVPTAETGPYHPTAIAYNRAKRSRMQTRQSTGDHRSRLATWFSITHAFDTGGIDPDEQAIQHR